MPGAWRCQAQFYREFARGRRDAGNNRHVQRWWWPVTAVQGSCPIEGGRAWLFTENFAENSIPSMKKCASYKLYAKVKCEQRQDQLFSKKELKI